MKNNNVVSEQTNPSNSRNRSNESITIAITRVDETVTARVIHRLEVDNSGPGSDVFIQQEVSADLSDTELSNLAPLIQKLAARSRTDLNNAEEGREQAESSNASADSPNGDNCCGDVDCCTKKGCVDTEDPDRSGELIEPDDSGSDRENCAVIAKIGTK